MHLSQEIFENLYHKYWALKEKILNLRNTSNGLWMANNPVVSGGDCIAYLVKRMKSRVYGRHYIRVHELN